MVSHNALSNYRFQYQLYYDSSDLHKTRNFPGYPETNCCVAS